MVRNIVHAMKPRYVGTVKSYSMDTGELCALGDRMTLMCEAGCRVSKRSLPVIGGRNPSLCRFSEISRMEEIGKG